MAGQKKEFDWFDHPSSRRLLWRLLWGACALSVIAEFFVHRHSYFGIDGFFGFYAVLGFGGCVVMILIAKGWAKVVKRNEDYYNDHTEDDVIPEDIDDGHAD